MSAAAFLSVIPRAKLAIVAGADTIEHGFGTHSALRSGRWKAIYFYDRKKWELYDLASDVGEQHGVLPDARVGSVRRANRRRATRRPTRRTAR